MSDSANRELTKSAVPNRVRYNQTDQLASKSYATSSGNLSTHPPSKTLQDWVNAWLVDSNGKHAGGLLKRPAPPPPPRSGTNACVCSMEVRDFDATAGAIQKHGGQVAMPKFAVPGTCWQGYFLDLEGTRLACCKWTQTPNDFLTRAGAARSAANVVLGATFRVMRLHRS